MHALLRFFAASLAALALAFASTARADAGHDHGDAPDAALAPVPARVVIESPRFELVGVVDGRTLTVWLDHPASNAPVTEARVELTLGGTALALQPHGDGRFEALLADTPAAGTTPVVATVTDVQGRERLAGELVVPSADAHADAAHAHGPRGALAWGLGALVALVLALVFGLAVARHRRSHPTHLGEGAV